MVEDKIYPEDERAAGLKTVEGWVSRNGKFYGIDETSARNCGATVFHCGGCGEDTEYYYRHCKKCEAAAIEEQYQRMQEAEWLLDVPVFDACSKNYFNSMDEIEYHCENEGISFSDLRLIICEPVYPQHIDFDDLIPILGVDMEFNHPELVNYVQEFNQKIDDLKIILGWQPGDFRASIKNESEA